MRKLRQLDAHIRGNNALFTLELFVIIIMAFVVVLGRREASAT
jgi:hypothetical protein